VSTLAARASLGEKGDIELRPAGYLGEAFFAIYRAATSGTKYDRTRKCQVTAPKRWPALKRTLLDMGFEVYEDAGVSKLAESGIHRKGFADATLDTRVSDAEDRTGWELYDYQREGIDFLSRRKGALLADEQGLGKTLQTCLAIPPGVSVLVVAPAVAQGVWRDAIHGPPGRPGLALRPELTIVTAKEVGTLPQPQPGVIVLATYEDTVRAVSPVRKDKVRIPSCVFPTWAGEGERCETAEGPLCVRAKPALPLLKKPLTALQLLAAPELRARIACPERSAMVPRIRQLCAARHALVRAFEKRPPAYDLVVADEAHYLKNPKSQRNKAFRALSDAAERVWLLTGTPLPSTPPELWAVLDAADIALEAFGSFDEFCQLFGAEEQFIERWDPVKKEKQKIRFLSWPTDRAPDLEEKLSEEAAESLSGIMLRRTKKGKLDLPDKAYRTVPVALPKRVDALMEKARAQVLAELGVDLATDEDLDEKVPFAMIAATRAAVAEAKIPALLDLLDLHEAGGEKVIVFSAHLEPLRQVGARKGWASITGETPTAARREAERAFQAGELHGLACSIRAAGTALTLHRATVEVFADLDWVPANNAQAEDRAHRIGTDHVVVVEHLVSDHPIDRHVSEVLARKSRLISTTFSKVE
jgi:hypothetical protein